MPEASGSVTVTSVTPASGVPGDSFVIAGTGFTAGQAVTTCGETVTSPTYTDAEHITATVPDAARGLGDVTVAGVSLSNAFTAPTFFDDYETGDFAVAEGGYSDAKRSGSASLTITSTLPRTGIYSVETTFGPSWAELGLVFGAYRSEFWIQYDWYVPANYYHAASNPSNNKFFVFWRDVYDPAQCLIVCELEDAGTGKSYMICKMNHSADAGVVEQIRSDVGGKTGSGFYPAFVGAAYPIVPGNWANIRVHVKSASGADAADGALQVWADGVARYDRTDLSIWFKQGGTPDDDPQPTFHHAYLLGATNAAFAAATTFHIDNLAIYDADPGWG